MISYLMILQSMKYGLTNVQTCVSGQDKFVLTFPKMVKDVLPHKAVFDGRNIDRFAAKLENFCFQ